MVDRRRRPETTPFQRLFNVAVPAGYVPTLKPNHTDSAQSLHYPPPPQHKRALNKERLDPTP